MKIVESERKFSQEEGDSLLKLARNSIQTEFSKIVSFASVQHSHSKIFPEMRGIFVGLWLEKVMRGCMGIPWPDRSLEETVQEMAVKSALEDARFAPLQAKELPHIKIEITILTTPRLIEYDQIQLGVHGLIIHREEGTGLLLPDVPLEYGWNVQAFLAATCLKGNLPVNTWKDEQGVYAFEVQTFKEN